MNQLRHIVLITIFLVITKSVTCQSKYLLLNANTIDTIAGYIAKKCTSYGSRKEVTKREFKRDKRQIAFLNEFFNNDLSFDEILLRTSHFGCKACSLNRIDLGGFVKYESRIPTEGYLHVYISFALFQNQIVYKRIYFKTKYSTDCLNPDEPMLCLQDIKYLRKYVVPVVNFPMIFSRYDYYVTSETLNVEKLNSITNGAYIFFLSPLDKNVNSLIWYGLDTYSINGVELVFRDLVKDINITVLKQLLYSPNQIIAINAMEALTYLVDTLHVQLAEEEKQKIAFIKNSDVNIQWQRGDIGGDKIAYKDLKNNDLDD